MQRINALSLLCGTTGNENVIFKTMNQQDRFKRLRWTPCGEPKSILHRSYNLFIYLFSFCFHKFCSGFVFNYVKLA